MRFALILFSALSAAPLSAEEHDHLVEADGIHILHAWTNAGRQEDMRVYMEIQNNRDTPIFLTGAELEDGTTGQIVGAAMKADGDPMPLPGIEIQAHRDLTLSPDTLYVRLGGAAPSQEGDEIPLHLSFEDLPEIEIHVETLPSGAHAHPHAGHDH